MGSGMEIAREAGDLAGIWWTKRMGLMIVESMTKSLEVETFYGKSLQPSEPGVAPHGTETGAPYSPETVVVLSAMVAGMLGEMLSPDAVWLAMRKAEKMSADAGVSKEEFERVKAGLTRFWEKKKAENPLGSMF
jgi:preprotein translocase subunit Sec61beta